MKAALYLAGKQKMPVQFYCTQHHHVPSPYGRLVVMVLQLASSFFFYNVPGQAESSPLFLKYCPPYLYNGVVLLLFLHRHYGFHCCIMLLAMKCFSCRIHMLSLILVILTLLYFLFCSGHGIHHILMHAYISRTSCFLSEFSYIMTLLLYCIIQ